MSATLDKYSACQGLGCFKWDEVESCVAFRYESSYESSCEYSDFKSSSLVGNIPGSTFILTLATRILSVPYILPTSPTILVILFSSFVFHQSNTHLTIIRKY